MVGYFQILPVPRDPKAVNAISTKKACLGQGIMETESAFFTVASLLTGSICI